MDKICRHTNSGMLGFYMLKMVGVFPLDSLVKVASTKYLSQIVCRGPEGHKLLYYYRDLNPFWLSTDFIASSIWSGDQFHLVMNNAYTALRHCRNQPAIYIW